MGELEIVKKKQQLAENVSSDPDVVLILIRQPMFIVFCSSFYLLLGWNIQR